MRERNIVPFLCKLPVEMKHYIVHSIVELSRIAFQEPELPLSQKKSDVILAKKTVLIGEVVNGGALPNPAQHIPTCSFDSQNKYCGEGLQTELPSSQGTASTLSNPGKYILLYLQYKHLLSSKHSV